MANATTNLLVAGLLVVLPVSAGNPGRGQGAQDTVPDVIVYVESEMVASSVLLRAEAMASRMFAGIGVRVQWTGRRPGRSAEAASGGCAPKRPEEIVVRMVSRRARFATSDALAYALPYASDGVRITVFYSELREALRDQPRLEPVLLAHVLVHEITHGLQRVERHSSTGVMRARWNPAEYSDMEKRPLNSRVTTPS